MVDFGRIVTMEKKLSPEAIEKAQIGIITGSEEWQHHQRLHKKSGMQDAKLFIPGEAVLGEIRDPVRERFGLQQEAKPKEEDTSKKKGLAYGPQTQDHAGGHYMGANDPNRPGFWATCNCGADFSAQTLGDGSVKVKSYLTDQTAQQAATGNYQTRSSTTDVYGTQQQQTSY
jgi:hypothetical protein